MAGFGDPNAAVVLVGLAPAAHGANRTGRMFTGDRSGDFLYAALHRCGFANQPTATHRGDGLALTGAYVTAAVRCAPPQNKPTPAERDSCADYLVRELALLRDARVVVTLGGFAHNALCALLGLKPKPPFGHGAVAQLDDADRRQLPDHRRVDDEPPLTTLTHLVGCYHPSQQNTFTGRLTPDMLDDVLSHARALANL